jgi:DNA-binding NarL/FixJ family response regulator
LTPRQAEVLRYLAHGSSTDQIASELRLSKETVRNHIRALLKKLGAHTRLEAVAKARAAGLV